METRGDDKKARKGKRRDGGMKKERKETEKEGKGTVKENVSIM